MKQTQEKILLEEIDEILYESYPPIFLELRKDIRNSLSNQFYIGPNSKQVKIDSKDIYDKKYSDGIIIITDKSYKPLHWIAGGRNNGIESTYRLGSKDKLNNLKSEDYNFFYITPDFTTVQTTDSRTERGEFSKSEKNKYLRSKERSNISFETKETEAQINRRLIKYVDNKTKEIKKLIADELRKDLKNYTNKIKEDIDTFNDKIGIIIKKSGPQHGKNATTKEEYDKLVQAEKDKILKKDSLIKISQINMNINTFVETYNLLLQKFNKYTLQERDIKRKIEYFTSADGYIYQVKKLISSIKREK